VRNKWFGITPTHCDVCGDTLKDSFIDGRTKTGFWAIMCEACHKEFGVGLGVGKGQKYKLKRIKEGEEEWIKVKRSN